ncbi:MULTISPECIES: pilus assembly protein [unclassified Agarivorans]|uniref:pilus assembly protein n=1 Tax=unclassified Agarivorans TaxID=2636026 RepID=UPI003D7C3D89
MSTFHKLSKLVLGLLLLPFSVASLSLNAANLNLADVPLYVATVPAPMVMLVMGRDHTLYYEAYNDASDLDGDGVLDTTYQPTQIDYYGYFDSQRCYAYNEQQQQFEPGEAATSGSKTCGGAAQWSGDFLNYLTMSRMDVLRSVLYGGLRDVDSSSQTVLERAYIPQDAHSWGKSYTSEAVNHYDLSAYTPFDNPLSGNKHFFGTATFSSNDNAQPKLVMLKNINKNNAQWNNFGIDVTAVEDEFDIWYWASKEAPVLTGSVDESYVVRVQVCVSGKLESNCKHYPNGNDKPTGLLHQYGEDGSIDFGLITGSYQKNLSGGVLRKRVGPFSDELNTNNGIFNSGVNGIVRSIDKLKIYGYNGSSYDHCGWVSTRAIVDGECSSWGNPLGEMLYESLRYFHGEKLASPSYSIANGSIDNGLGLPIASWDDPFEGREYCAAPYNLVISDINPSYDSDELPGGQFTNAYQGSTLDGFSLSTLLNTISTTEGITGNYFIGESIDDSTDTRGAPTAKAVTSLAKIRGLSPQEPTKEGSYSAAGVAYYGHKTDLFPAKSGKQNIQTSVVAISSPLPEVRVKVDDKVVTVVPFAKSVGGNSINKNKGAFQPTNTIVDYYVESFSDTSGVFRIAFEDVEQGADHDMDMVVKYSYEVKDLCPHVGDNEATCNKTKGVALTLDSTYARGDIHQHAGYVISGTTKDGIYLDVKDQDGGHVNYYLDTPSEREAPFPNNTRKLEASTADLPWTRTRYFFPNGNTAGQLKSPLWYAAKWGGFNDENGSEFPDTNEWDAETSGQPDGYFPVTNAGQLGAQITKALDKTLAGDRSASSPVFNSNFLQSDTLLYQSSFNSEHWNGDVKAYSVDVDGELSSSAIWSVAAQIDSMAFSSRSIYTRNPESDEIVKFSPPSSLLGDSHGLSEAQIDDLLAGQQGSDESKLAYLAAVVNYLRGERTYEASDLSYSMRAREAVLGDVIHSIPYYVAPVNGHRVTTPVLVFGANDGMVHVINASNGEEAMAYVPSQVYGKLNSLTRSTYSHQYFVDGGVTAYTDGVGSSARTTAVGRLGTGAKGFYAIDVSDMSRVNKDKIKWEISATGDFSGLGLSAAAPTIAKLANGKVGVIFANGYNADDSEAKLYIADLDDGSLIATLHTHVDSADDPTGEQRPNALASPAVVDINSDGVADRIYAGDLFGNMWAFDVSATSSSRWGIAIAGDKPLFKAVSPDKPDVNYTAQAITSRPSVGAHPKGITAGVLVAFGTGKYIETTDNNAIGEATQSVYAIWDKLDDVAFSSSRSKVDGLDVYNNLLRQTIEKEDFNSATRIGNRLLSENVIDWSQHRGWYLDLINTADGNTNNYGERQVSNTLLLANKLSFTSLLPSADACAGGGSGWYMEMNLHSGLTWNTGTEGNTDADDQGDTINNDSSHQLVEGGIPSSPTVIINPNLDQDNAVKEEGIIEKNCITLSDGTVKCFDDYQSPTGRLSLRTLY